MEIDYSAYLEHLMRPLLKSDTKLQTYMESHYNEELFIEFINYINKFNFSIYSLSMKDIQNCCDFFSCGVDISQYSIEDFKVALNQLHLPTVIQLLFNNKNLIDAFKDYLKSNPLKTLRFAPYLYTGINKSINPYLNDYYKLIYIDNDFKEYSSRDFSSIKKIIKTLALSSDYSANNSLSIYITTNIITFNYKGTSINALLVNYNDEGFIENSFLYLYENEKSMILNSFFNKKIPYGLLVSYLFEMHKYITPKITTKTYDEKPQSWVIAKYKEIENNEYFKKLAENFSISFSVFVNSIYSRGNICDLFKESELIKITKSSDYLTFNLLNWLYLKKNRIN